MEAANIESITVDQESTKNVMVGRVRISGTDYKITAWHSGNEWVVADCEAYQHFPHIEDMIESQIYDYLEGEDVRLGDLREEDILADLKCVDAKARKTVNSGATRGDGDIHTSQFCIEVKDRPKAKNFNIARQDMEKLKRATLNSGNSFGALIMAIPSETNPHDTNMVAVIDYNDFLVMMEGLLNP